ncbi:hypothetical protein HPB50_002283 [Hyalomma asiaticum]|uniref:Uncharacterized protein n=1 Tax=Hyalomma asiaticum TaxID=266040 RepID=A0ACB7S4U7_HYAAI|nr:hypothetical protein HPB50_002283 [Hyalomma asiaticum]
MKQAPEKNENQTRIATGSTHALVAHAARGIRTAFIIQFAMVPNRYRTAVTIGVVGVLSCMGVVIFSLTAARDRQRPSSPDCNSSSCQDSRPDAASSRRSRGAVSTECRSFYDFVCGRHYHTRPLIHQQAVLSLATRLNASLHAFPPLSEAFLRGSCPGHYVLLALDMYRACMAPTVKADWEQVARLLRRLGLAGWPMVRAQPLDLSPWDLAGVIDFRLGVFALARLSLRRHYGRVIMQLDRTPLPLRLHQLALQPQELSSYVRTVEKALALLQSGAVEASDGGNGARKWSAAAASIVQLEQSLERAQPRDAFVYGARMIELGDLPVSRHWNWAEYVAIVRNDSGLLAQANLTLLVHEPEQLALTTETLGNTSAAVIFNYFGYRVLLHLAPLLPAEAHFLLPLAPSADAGPPHLVGCLRLLAHLHPFAFRFFAGLQPGQAQYHPPTDEGRAHTLFAAAQRATAAVVETLPWREKGTGLRRASLLLQTRLVIGGDATSQRQQHCLQGPVPQRTNGGILEALFQVQSTRLNAFWLAESPDDGLDSRHQIEPFSMRADYFVEPNVVYASPALSMALYERPLGDVQAAAPLVEALLRAALPGEPHELLRISPVQLRCLARRLGTSPYDAHMPDHLRELLQPSALLALSARVSPMPSVRFVDRKKYLGSQLFFVHWAMTLCDAPQLQKRLRRYKLVPTQNRIDVTLTNHAAFHKAWHCPSGTAMHRSKACPPLTI